MISLAASAASLAVRKSNKDLKESSFLLGFLMDIHLLLDADGSRMEHSGGQTSPRTTSSHAQHDS